MLPGAAHTRATNQGRLAKVPLCQDLTTLYVSRMRLLSWLYWESAFKDMAILCLYY
jgi:hypothetical protein